MTNPTNPTSPAQGNFKQHSEQFSKTHSTPQRTQSIASDFFSNPNSQAFGQQFMCTPYSPVVDPAAHIAPFAQTGVVFAYPAPSQIQPTNQTTQFVASGFLPNPHSQVFGQQFMCPPYQPVFDPAAHIAPFAQTGVVFAYPAPSQIQPISQTTQFVASGFLPNPHSQVFGQQFMCPTYQPVFDHAAHIAQIAQAGAGFAYPVPSQIQPISQTTQSVASGFLPNLHSQVGQQFICPPCSPVFDPAAQIAQAGAGFAYPVPSQIQSTQQAMRGHHQMLDQADYNAAPAMQADRRIVDSRENQGSGGVHGIKRISPKDLSPKDLSQLVWSNAKHRIKNIPLFEAIARGIIERSKTEEKLAEFDPQSLTMIAWSYAKLDITNKALFKAIASEVIARSKTEEKLAKFDPQSLTMMAWSHAKLGITNEDLLEAIASEVITRSKTEEKLAEFAHQSLTMMAWSHAKLGITNEDLLEAIASEVIERSKTERKLTEFNPQNLTMIAWSYAKLGITNKALFEAIASEIIARSKTEEKLAEFPPQNLTTLAWSHAELGITNEELFEAIASEVIERNKTKKKLTKFPPQNLTTLARSYAELGITNKDFFEVIASEVVKRIKDERWAKFSRKNLDHIAWSYKKLGITNEDLLEAIAKKRGKKPRKSKIS